ncbi:MAG: hypothetical protein HQ515_11600 [Phycisphaeraceae bacterium]|nr:hypothetical protein [Phycisphaeraceae bacterium]
MWYKILMCICLPLLAIGWVAYWWWERKLDKEEAAMPEEDKSTDTLKQSRSDVSDWAEQMANFKKPERKPPTYDD